MYKKIKQWIIGMMCVGCFGLGVVPVGAVAQDVSVSEESEKLNRPADASPEAVPQEVPPVKVEKSPSTASQENKKEEGGEIEKRVWPSEVNGLRIKQDAPPSVTDFLSLEPLAQLNVESVEWGAYPPVTNKVGDFTTSLLVTTKEKKQFLYQEVPYLVYSYKDETLINGLSYDKQAKKLTGKTDPKVLVTAEAHFSQNPADVEITATESDENGVFAFAYDKEPLTISLTVEKDPHVQYATTKYEVETNQVEMNYQEQSSESSQEFSQTATTSESMPAVAKKKATSFPQTGEKLSSSLGIVGGGCLFLGIVFFVANLRKIKMKS